MAIDYATFDANRVLEILNELQEFTEGPYRTQRLALSAEDAAARSYFGNWAKRQGLRLEIDPVGNQLAFREGRQEGAFVGFGSHLDTVKNAGQFDGTLGMAVSMCFIEWLNAQDIVTDRPLCVINFTNEEGVRFIPSIMGSAYMAGQISLDEVVLSSPALEEHVTVGDELKNRQLAGTFDSRAVPLHCFLELHIEQGPVLESEKLQIGVVERVQGMYWTEYIFEGRAQHTGTTPLHLRQNAGQAAAQFVHEAYQLSLAYDQHLLSNGVFELKPNAPNIIASRARVILDSRNPHLEALKEVQKQVDQLASDVAKAYDVTVRHQTIERYDPVQFAQEVVEAVQASADDTGYSSRRMHSGAGHDAGLIGMKEKAAMIFIPSKDGISHNPAEYSSPEEIRGGLEVFIRTLMKLSNNLA